MQSSHPAALPSHPGATMETAVDVSKCHRPNLDKKTSFDAPSKKRQRPPSRETVQVDSDDDKDKGQRARDTVAQIEQGGAEEGIFSAVGKFGKSSYEKARQGVLGLTRSFMGVTSPSLSGKKNAGSGNSKKRQSFGKKGKRIIPGRSLGNNSPPSPTQQTLNFSSNSESSNKVTRTTRSRSVKKTRKEREEIVIDSSDDEADEKKKVRCTL